MLEFFRIDKNRARNSFAALKFGFACGLFIASMRYLARWICAIPPTKTFLCDLFYSTFCFLCIFAVIYYFLLVLFDLHYLYHKE